MMLRLSLLLASLNSVSASTSVAVIEFGRRGAVRRTDAQSPSTTVDGVASFWKALHQNRRLQHAGMTVVPDLFNKADVGIVIGIDGVDIDHMPTIDVMMHEEGEGVVGVMKVEGFHCHDLMTKVDQVDEIKVGDLKSAAENKVANGGFSALQMTAGEDLEKELAAAFESLTRAAEESGKTIVVHLVIEEDMSTARRRLSSRRLEGEGEGEGEGEQGGEGEGQQGEGEGEGGEDKNNAEDDNNAQGQSQYSGYYGYGYFNAYDEWVTPYKTMFQIQYFNVVLWTAIGLTVSLFFVLYLMIYMPLEPDTLLFGEQAKYVGGD